MRYIAFLIFDFGRRNRPVFLVSVFVFAQHYHREIYRCVAAIWAGVYCSPSGLRPDGAPHSHVMGCRLSNGMSVGPPVSGHHAVDCLGVRVVLLDRGQSCLVRAS